MTVQEMRYILSEARAEQKVKIRELDKIGLRYSDWDKAVYRRGDTKVSVMARVAEALGYELVLLRRREDA